MPGPLSFYFDFISPYAYLAWPRVRGLAVTHGVGLALEPVLFAALLDHHEQRGPAEIAPKREAMQRQILRMAATAGLPLVGPATHPFRPLTALRVALPEVAGDRAADVVEALFAAGWGEGADLGDDVAIESALKRAGLDGAALVGRTRAPDVKRALAEGTERAIAAGVFGVPTVLYEGELFWGNDQIDHLALVLEGRDPLDRAALARMRARPSSARRR